MQDRASFAISLSIRSAVSVFAYFTAILPIVLDFLFVPAALELQGHIRPLTLLVLPIPVNFDENVGYCL